MVLKTYTAILSELCDLFDSLITPKRIRRSDKNIIYLILKSIAKGVEIVYSITYALASKFDPEKCTDTDLLSVARLVGTEKIEGNGSGLVIQATNNNPVDSLLLPSGEYRYLFNEDIIFSFIIPTTVSIAPLETKTFFSFTTTKGSYPVSEQSTITVLRADEAALPAEIVFSCLDNKEVLGTEDESNYDFRKRILTDTTRADAISRLELAIKNKPYIFDCSLAFNQTIANIVIGGITIPPYHLLITLSGSPTDEIAELVAQHTFYPTVQTVGDIELNYYSDLLANGMYTIHCREFTKIPYALVITYMFDGTLILESTVQAEINKALAVYMNPTKRIAYITEREFYNVIENLSLLSVKALNITLTQNSIEVPYVAVDTTSMSQLTSVTFIGV